MITCPRCRIEYEPDAACVNEPHHFHCPSCQERSDGNDNELEGEK